MRIQSKNLNILQIADSGQCFRMNKIDNNQYSIIAFGSFILLTQVDEETVDISCSEEEFHLIWEEFFDLSYDYNRIVKSLTEGKDEFLKKAAEYGKGIRILRQEPFEALISFIISQNKNIPSIKCCIERICEKYGETKVSKEGVQFTTFPTPEQLTLAKKEDLRELKLGYRDDYIIKAAQAVFHGAIDLMNLMKCSHEETVRTLRSIPGVGDKVANCASLYGLHHIEAFPIDVWIARVLTEVYQNNFDIEKYKGYAGIVQQYMFYYMRYLKNNPC